MSTLLDALFWYPTGIYDTKDSNLGNMKSGFHFYNSKNWFFDISWVWYLDKLINKLNIRNWKFALFSFSENYKNRVWKTQVMLKKQDRSEQEKPVPRPSKQEWTEQHAEIVRKNKVSPR